MENKIDFVITWVDGSDPEWQAEKHQYSKDTTSDSREVRYRDWDILKYWFRSVEEHTPWVNKIHFVTWGHLPAWLNTKNPQLNIVKHTDYIPERYLPTYNSHTIEWNIHRIPDLADNFVYFNDDMIITQPMKPTDFFINELPADTLEEAPYLCSFRNSIGSIVANNMEILNTNFDKKSIVKKNRAKWFNPKYGKSNVRTFYCQSWKYFIGFAGSHFTNSYRKETFAELWDKEFDILDQTCRHKFRDKSDVNHWLARYWQLVNGSFVPRAQKKQKYFTLSDNHSELCHAIEKNTYQILCINDKDEKMNFDKIKENLHIAFDAVFPEKSSFEKEI